MRAVKGQEWPLPRVGLVGILVYECPEGHGVVPQIPRVGELHRVIAEAFIKKPELLDGSELRFLRKNAGFSAQRFATLLAINPAHLSRVENGKQKALGPSTDRLARLYLEAELKGVLKRDVRHRGADALIAAKQQRRKDRSATFELDKKQNRWKEKKAA